jgi:hypothetical protein
MKQNLSTIKRNKTRQINQLIDKFNCETNENKRIRILEQIDNLD